MSAPSERFRLEKLNYALAANAVADVFDSINISGVSGFILTIVNDGPGTIEVKFKRASTDGIPPIELTALTKTLLTDEFTEVAFSQNSGVLFTLSAEETAGNPTTIQATLRAVS